jgi:hypothetical protein
MTSIPRSLTNAEQELDARVLYQVRQSELLRRIRSLPEEEQAAFVAYSVALGSDATSQSVRDHLLRACEAGATDWSGDDAGQLAAALEQLARLEAWEA